MHFSVRARPQNALFRRVRFSSPAQTWSHLTQRRILCRRPHVKAQSGGVTLTQKRILHRRCHRDVTERRILDGRRHGKAHFACGPHQKAHSACGRWLRREAIFADLCTLLHTHVCPQRRNSVHKCPKTAPRGHLRRSVYTPADPRPLARPGGGHKSHGVDGPMAPVMPECPDLRSMPPGR